MEQLKLRKKEKFGQSSEKSDTDQISFADLGSDFFNEPESIREPIMQEPGEEIIKNDSCSSKKQKKKRNSKYKNLETEIVEYKLPANEMKCEICGEPLTEMKKEIRKELLENNFLHADETTLEVLNEPGRKTSAKSYMWLYRTSVYSEKPVIIFDYQVGRSGKFAEEFLKNWKGTYLHCDGYNGYKKLKNKVLCGCFVHARRKFHEAKLGTTGKSQELAKQGENYINKLFALEKTADDKALTPEERFSFRNAESKKVLDEFYKWMNSVSSIVLPKSLLGTAFTYMNNQKEYLYNFLEDGHIQLSNNLAEQSIKLFVIGRKNWLFSNSINGADSSALLYSIIQTAVANKLKPQHYLEYIFTQIQHGKDKNVKDFLPWSDKIPELCKNKAQIKN